MNKDVYCDKCSGCGEEGCCSPLNCAQKQMSGCKYGQGYFKDIEFAYRLADALQSKYEDDEIFDKVWSEVYE